MLWCGAVRCVLLLAVHTFVAFLLRLPHVSSLARGRLGACPLMLLASERRFFPPCHGWMGGGGEEKMNV